MRRPDLTILLAPQDDLDRKFMLTLPLLKKVSASGLIWYPAQIRTVLGADLVHTHGGPASRVRLQCPETLDRGLPCPLAMSATRQQKIPTVDALPAVFAVRGLVSQHDGWDFQK